MRKKIIPFMIAVSLLMVFVPGCSQRGTEQTAEETEATATPSEVSKTLANPTKEDIDVRIAALKDADSNVRANAAYELGIAGDPRAVEPLIAVLQDEDTFVRNNAAGALGSIGDVHAVEPLITAAQNELGDNLPAILSALGAIGGERATEALLEALTKESERYWKPAAEALKGMGPAVVKPLIAMLDGKEAGSVFHAAYTLAQIDDFYAVEALNAAFEEQNLPAVAGACNYFIKVGKDDSISLLISAINEYGTDDMAITYLNCGNEQLADAAKSWAKKNGYEVTQYYISQESTNTLHWGSNK